MSIIEQIKAEIERQLNLSNEKRGLARRTKDYYNEVAYGAEMDVCNRLLSFLSDLEKSEKPIIQEGLEEEIKRYGEKNMFNIPAFQQVARHFAKWGAEHLKK